MLMLELPWAGALLSPMALNINVLRGDYIFSETFICRYQTTPAPVIKYLLLPRFILPGVYLVESWKAHKHTHASIHIHTDTHTNNEEGIVNLEYEIPISDSDHSVLFDYMIELRTLIIRQQVRN